MAVRRGRIESIRDDRPLGQVIDSATIVVDTLSSTTGVGGNQLTYAGRMAPTSSTDQHRGPGRRRPSMSRGDRQEADLLDTTERLLRDQLPSQLTIGAIAAETGLSRSTVYFYFDSKEAIISAAVYRAVAPLLEYQERAFDEEVSAVSFPLALRRLFETWREHAGLLSGVMELVASDPSFRGQWRKYMEDSVEAQAAAVERDRARGLPVLAEDPRPKLLALCWMTERSCYMLFSREHSAEEEAALLDTLLDNYARTLEIPASG